MITADDLLNAMKEERATFLTKEEVARLYKECLHKLDEAKATFANGLVGKRVKFEKADGLHFWPKQPGQNWWGCAWKHKTWNDHDWFEEACTHGQDDVQGVVMGYGRRHYFFSLVVEGRYFYHSVPFSTWNLQRFQVLEKAAA